MCIVYLSIPGEPTGKGRPRFSTAGGIVRTHTPKPTAVYENLVKHEYVSGQHPKLSGQIYAEIEAYYSVPKSETKKRKASMFAGDVRPTKKPDCDNIAKIVLDALNGLAYDDDSQVVKLKVSKWYVATETEQPHVSVTLKEINT